MNIRFLTLAQKEVDESVHWYDEQANLGRGFLDELDRGVRLIKSHPLASTEIDPGIRRCLLHRFPYALISGRGHDRCDRLRRIFIEGRVIGRIVLTSRSFLSPVARAVDEKNNNRFRGVLRTYPRLGSEDPPANAGGTDLIADLALPPTWPSLTVGLTRTPKSADKSARSKS
jgi:hypothetical protein